MSVIDALAKLNEARSVARMCGTTSYAAAPPVQWSAALAEAALAHSTDMATQNYFSHDGLDGSTPTSRITAAGFSGNYTGENIYAGPSTMDAVITGWLQSPGHCANIMNPKYKYYGIGCAYDSSSKYRYYWTQDFGG